MNQQIEVEVEEELLESPGDNKNSERAMTIDEKTETEDSEKDENNNSDGTNSVGSEAGLSSVETPTGFQKVAMPENTEPIQINRKERGICQVCGNPAQHGRSFFCDEHVALSPTLNKGTGLKRPRTPQDEAKLIERGKKQKLVRLILDNNDGIVTAQCWMLQVPDDWRDKTILEMVMRDQNGNTKEVKFWEPTLNEQLRVSQREAEFVAGALVKFSESQQAKMFAGLTATLAPYIEILGAVGFVAYRFIKLEKFRKDIETVKFYAAKQQEEMKARANGGVTPFPDQEPSMNSDESSIDGFEAMRHAVNES